MMKRLQEDSRWWKGREKNDRMVREEKPGKGFDVDLCGNHTLTIHLD